MYAQIGLVFGAGPLLLQQLGDDDPARLGEGSGLFAIASIASWRPLHYLLQLSLVSFPGADCQPAAGRRVIKVAAMTQTASLKSKLMVIYQSRRGPVSRADELT